ncbi:hypothetical protein EDB19DRAFT_1829542 [Suillus lakei]|nr:hypothetical protein EDB19DRAFT_1829542 [Suillus lakei]
MFSYSHPYQVADEVTIPGYAISWRRRLLQRPAPAECHATAATQVPACFKSQNNYLRQWVPRTKEYLNILLQWEAPASWSCIICGTDGGFFEDSCLVKTGLVISLGHSRNPCPCQDFVSDDIYNLFTDTDTGNAKDANDIPGPTADATEQDEHMTGKWTWIPNDLPTGVLFIKNSKKITTIVDKSGIHTHKINYCRCTSVPTADVQLCQMGLLLASFTQPKTAFTFDILDDFLLDNLECGTSAMNYYYKLRRMTTSVFPHLVPVRPFIKQWRWVNILAGPLPGVNEGG